jgi:hypothetical protein
MKLLATAATILGLVAFSGVASAMCSGADYAKPDQTAETPIIVPPTTGS